MRRTLAAGTAVAVVVGLAVPSAVAATATGHRTTVGTKPGDGRSVLEAKGRYAYTHLTSSGKEVGCNSACRKVWPVVTSTAAPKAAGGVKQRKLGTTPHHQVTYYGHRLYFFTYDAATVPLGKGITSFGGKWRLITVTGVAG